MTMPHLMNCGHSDTGWCLSCVGKLQKVTDNLGVRINSQSEQIKTMRIKSESYRDLAVSLMNYIETTEVLRHAKQELDRIDAISIGALK